MKLLLCVFFAFLVGCTTTDYFGKTYPPTQGAEVFFNPQDVRRSYEVMGEIHAKADDIISFQAMQRQLVSEAMQKGADAILIEHLGTTQTGFTTVENRTTKKDKKSKKTTSTISTTQNETNRVIIAKLLKYRG
jgi:hypothetical protein